MLAYVHAEFHISAATTQLPPSVIGEGKVIAVVPASEQLVVEHGEIKGFMEAMIMGYKVKPPSLLANLKARHGPLYHRHAGPGDRQD